MTDRAVAATRSEGPVLRRQPSNDQAALSQEPLERTDAARFGEFYALHRDAVFRFVRHLSPSEDAAAEITAVAFYKAFQSLSTFDGRVGGFLPWILRIARNAAVDAQRRGRPWLYLSTLLPSTHPRALDDPEMEALARDRSRLLAEALARLPRPQREALSLRFGAGLTSREIGEVIGKREEAAQKLLRRALDRLQEDLHDR